MSPPSDVHLARQAITTVWLVPARFGCEVAFWAGAAAVHAISAGFSSRSAPRHRQLVATILLAINVSVALHFHLGDSHHESLSRSPDVHQAPGSLWYRVPTHIDDSSHACLTPDEFVQCLPESFPWIQQGNVPNGRASQYRSGRRPTPQPTLFFELKSPTETAEASSSGSPPGINRGRVFTLIRKSLHEHPRT